MSKSLPAVITTLERAGGFARAQEVFQLMRKQGKSTGLATVYRALQKAASENTVDVLFFLQLRNERKSGFQKSRLPWMTHRLLWSENGRIF
jgi:Fe2+ or Zn2+ uptake regulation protein